MQQKAPQRARRWKKWFVVIALSGILVGSGWYAQSWRRHAKRFVAVREGVFYRSGQPTELGFRRLINDCGIKTVVSVQLFDFPLSRGIYDFGNPNGHKESEYVRLLGAKPLQWPMGNEKYWPWTTPWQFEEFFKLMDEPANWPVVLHCMGGRHRTGTFSALFRLEYDRWPLARVLEEMHSYEFGARSALQEMNLRAYTPRPRPNGATLEDLQTTFEPIVGKVADYDELVRALRKTGEIERRNEVLAGLLREGKEFSIALAQRLIDDPSDSLAPAAAEAALASFDRAASFDDWSMSAAILADYGDGDQQAKLFALVKESTKEAAVSTKYDAIASGLLNRFTANRLPYVALLVEDARGRPKDGARYCDMAVAHAIATVNENPLMYVSAADTAIWDMGRNFIRERFAKHPEELQLSQLIPTAGNNPLENGNGSLVEDLHLPPAKRKLR